MMKNDNIRIKQKNSAFLLYGFLYLFLILAGIFLLSMPFLSFAPDSVGLRAVLLAVGLLLTVGGGTLYGLLLYRGLCPKDALIITNKGFTNRLIGSKDGVYVEWVNVSSMKVFGLTKSPMLGLTLADNKEYIMSLDGKAARDAKANLELGLPVIAIAQRDVFLQIGELKNLFSRMIKGAISWEQYSTHNKKTEPTPVSKPAETKEEAHFEPTAKKPAATAEFPFTKTRVPDTSAEEEAPILPDEEETVSDEQISLAGTDDDTE